MNGLTFKKNKNGFIATFLHYSADLAKDLEWKKRVQPGYTFAAWEKEFEMNSEIMSGRLVYPDYNSDIHTISRSCINIDKLNKEGYRFRILDHGGTNPTAVLWIWVDREDNWIGYREYYVANQTIPFHATNIKKMSYREEYSESLADPSIFFKGMQTKSGQKISVSELYELEGILLSPANNNFASGWSIITERLRLNPDKINPFTGQKGSPGLFFVREDCPWIDWEIKRWRFQEFSSIKLAMEKNVKETTVDKDNHLMDCLTYFANNFVDAPEKQEKPKSVIQKDIDEILNKNQNQEKNLEDLFNNN